METYGIVPCQLMLSVIVPRCCLFSWSMYLRSTGKDEAHRSRGPDRVAHQEAQQTEPSFARDWAAPIVVWLAIIGLSLSIVSVLLSPAE